MLYSAHVALVRLEPFTGDFTAELMFDIVETTPDGSRYIDNGLETKSFLSDQDRRITLSVVCEMTAHIVKQQDPHVIVMTTSQTNLPDKALSKYQYLCDAIRSVGYVGGESNTYEGRHIWMFVKSNDVS